MAQPGKDDALNLLKGWFERDLGRYARWDRDVEVHAIEHDGTVRIRIYTDVHQFSISAGPGSRSQGYLGCIAHTRKPRAGEDWTRGNDLRDGPLSEETWIGIMGDIISYEMVRIHKDATSRQSVNPVRGQRVINVGADVPEATAPQAEGTGSCSVNQRQDGTIVATAWPAGMGPAIELEADVPFRSRIMAVAQEYDWPAIQVATCSLLDHIGAKYGKHRLGTSQAAA